MLTNDIRPRVFSEVKGQEYPVLLLKKVVKDPDNAPRIYLMHGPHGTGKTTLARVMARALNCPNTKNGEACLVCDQCKSMEGVTPFYQEYDCGVAGSVDKIREIRQGMMLDTTAAKYRVVVFDEFHMTSPEAQSSMLKVFEEMPSRTFVALCTTDPWKIKETIISRSIQIPLTKVSEEPLRELLDLAAKERGVSLSERLISAIIRSSDGHARDAIKLVDIAALVGEEAIEKEITSTDESVRKALVAIKAGDEESFKEALERISVAMNAEVAKAMYIAMEEILNPGIEGGELDVWTQDGINLFMIMTSSWAVNAMHGDATIQSLFWVLWGKFGRMDTGGGKVDRFNRKRR